MNKELLLKSDVIDIIFENRNKAYGAYNLRKYYDQRMRKAVGIMLGLAALVSAFAFLPKNDVVEVKTYIIPDPRLGHVATPKEKLPEAKPKVKVAVPASTAANTVLKTPVIVAKTDPSIKPIDVDPQATITNPGNTNTPGGPSIVTPVGGGGGTDSQETVVNVKPIVDKKTPINNPDIMPSYPGGWEALKKFLERNLQNPKEMEEGEAVSVKIKFVVGYDGKLQSFVTVEDGGAEFNKEVVRVLKKMPEWIPGKTNGENVSVYYTIPVKFVPAE